jgi:hypothetical protein
MKAFNENKGGAWVYNSFLKSSKLFRGSNFIVVKKI